MTDRKAEITDRLESNRKAISAFFRSLSSENLNVRVYREEPGWTVRQVLAHLVTIEASMHKLFENMLAGGQGFTAADFDVDRFNRSQPQKLDGLAVEEVMDRFSNVRDRTVSMVSAMGEADLDRTGSHPFHGQDRLERFVRWAYEHADLHLADARRALADR